MNAYLSRMYVCVLLLLLFTYRLLIITHKHDFYVYTLLYALMKDTQWFTSLWESRFKKKLLLDIFTHTFKVTPKNLLNNFWAQIFGEIFGMLLRCLCHHPSIWLKVCSNKKKIDKNRNAREVTKYWVIWHSYRLSISGVSWNMTWNAE